MPCPPRLATRSFRFMPLVALDPECVMQEVLAFNARLARGLSTFTQLGDVQVGVSPRTAVHRQDKVVLYHYEPQVPVPLAVPVLICYALVNRPYMADLQEGRSLIQGMLKQGLDVYLIDWGYPDGGDQFLTEFLKLAAEVMRFYYVDGIFRGAFRVQDFVPVKQQLRNQPALSGVEGTARFFRKFLRH